MNYRYSFIDLFSKEVDFDKNTKVTVSTVVVPQIQRPYAQGRTDGVCTYIRKTFLDDIFNKLTSDDDEILDLNFIYGIIKPNNDEYKLELLDGQQRLTTLFLLYWYVANAELDIEDERCKLVRDCLSRFLYETRSTSTVFCQELSAYHVAIGDRKPKDVIRSSKWYFKSFDRDSTINAMLTMLDAIHERYIVLEKKCLFEKLQKLQFYVKSLGVFNLSEELYIKMNARGLQLSPFENFKADLTNFVSHNEYYKYHVLVPLYKKDSSDYVPFYVNFSVKLDAKWVDIFWKNGADDFDKAYMSFFSRFFACKYIVASKNNVSDIVMRADETIKIFYTNAEEQIDKNEYFGFKEFGLLLDSHPEYIETLDKVLDVIYHYDCKSNDKVIFKNMLPVWDKDLEHKGDDFYCNTNAKMSHVKLIALSAMIEFVEAMDVFDVPTFESWMRVVWNIIENTNIDSLTPVSSLIRKFSAVIHFVSGKISENVSFYKALSLWHAENSTEREIRALLEEVEKAKRISDDPSWESVWKDVESHPYFKGMATFFYNPSLSLQEYSRNAIIAKSMFDKEGISSDYKEEHILIRAIVSCLSTWGEINERYITERAEKDKHLKSILASNEKVRSMLSNVVSNVSVENVKLALQSYINNAEAPQVWQNASENDVNAFNMALYRLRHDVKMYDWISHEEHVQNESFRVYWYEGHIMFAVPRRQYAKIALDTERAKMANELCRDYGFVYDDENQKLMYQIYGDSYGNSIWIKHERESCCVWIGFEQHHVLEIQVECKTKELAKKLIDSLEGSSCMSDNENCIQLPKLYHWNESRTYKKLCSVVESLFGVIS